MPRGAESQERGCRDDLLEKEGLQECTGIADRTGSFTPGKKADIVVIDGSAVNVAPVIDPVAAVVVAADTSNVDMVMVDGVVLKRDGKLVANLAVPRKAVEASRDFLVSKVETQPGWAINKPA